MKITLKDVMPGDLGWIISMHGSVYAQQFGFDINFEADIADKVASFYQNTDQFNRIFIAHQGDEPIGSVAVSRKTENTAFINFLLVLDHYRRQGIATHLMNRVIEYSQNSGFQKIQLETYSCLMDAREMYRKYRFQLYMVNKKVPKYSQEFDQEFWELRL